VLRIASAYMTGMSVKTSAMVILCLAQGDGCTGFVLFFRTGVHERRCPRGLGTSHPCGATIAAPLTPPPPPPSPPPSPLWRPGSHPSSATIPNRGRVRTARGQGRQPVLCGSRVSSSPRTKPANWPMSRSHSRSIASAVLTGMVPRPAMTHRSRDSMAQMGRGMALART